MSYKMLLWGLDEEIPNVHIRVLLADNEPLIFTVSVAMIRLWICAGDLAHIIGKTRDMHLPSDLNVDGRTEIAFFQI